MYENFKHTRLLALQRLLRAWTKVLFCSEFTKTCHFKQKLIELRFYIPSRHKIGHFGDVPHTNLFAWYGKTKPNTTKARIYQSKEMYYNTKN